MIECVWCGKIDENLNEMSIHPHCFREFIGAFKKYTKNRHAIKPIREEKNRVYRVVMCPKCGRIQVTMSSPEGQLSCKYCCGRCKMRKKGKWAVNVYYETEDAKLAQKICSELKAQNQ